MVDSIAMWLNISYHAQFHALNRAWGENPQDPPFLLVETENLLPLIGSGLCSVGQGLRGNQGPGGYANFGA